MAPHEAGAPTPAASTAAQGCAYPTGEAARGRLALSDLGRGQALRKATLPPWPLAESCITNSITGGRTRVPLGQGLCPTTWPTRLPQTLQTMWRTPTQASPRDAQARRPHKRNRWSPSKPPEHSRGSSGAGGSTTEGLSEACLRGLQCSGPSAGGNRSDARDSRCPSINHTAVQGRREVLRSLRRPACGLTPMLARATHGLRACRGAAAGVDGVAGT